MGVDIGGSGMKAALVDTESGELRTERRRIETPRPATPSAMLPVLRRLRDDLGWTGPIGCGFPGVVRHGRVCTAANLDAEWVGLEAADMMTAVLGQPVVIINDADAAGIAEVRLGAPGLAVGTTLFCTLGTGIGTAMFTDGHLFPNTELGHLDLSGTEAEANASARAKTEQDLSWKNWSKRLTVFLAELERLLWPDRFVIGGGISKKFAKYCSRLDISTPVQAATLLNEAGIVGAALSFEETAGSTPDSDPSGDFEPGN